MTWWEAVSLVSLDWFIWIEYFNIFQFHIGWSTEKWNILVFCYRKILSNLKKAPLLHICASTVPCYLLFLFPSSKCCAAKGQSPCPFRKKEYFIPLSFMEKPTQDALWLWRCGSTCKDSGFFRLGYSEVTKKCQGEKCLLKIFEGTFIPSTAEPCRRARQFKLGGAVPNQTLNKEDSPIWELPSGFSWQDFICEMGGYRGGFCAKFLQTALLSDGASARWFHVRYFTCQGRGHLWERHLREH